MAGITQAMELQMLRLWTGQTVTALTTPLKMKLCTTASTDAAQGTEVANAGGSTYSEQTIAFNTPVQGSSGSPSTVGNTSAVTYTNMPAVNGSNYITTIDIHDSAGTPVRALFASLTAPGKQTGLGDTVTFAASTGVVGSMI